MGNTTIRPEAQVLLLVMIVGGLSAQACGPDSMSLAETTQPIINGAVDTGDPSVVLFVAEKAGSLAGCTTTVITPRILLTAAHCITETVGFTYSLFLGADDAPLLSGMVAGMPVMTAVFNPLFDHLQPKNGHDLAVVVMPTPLSLKPIPLNRTPTMVGEMARYVGYGLSNLMNPNSIGIKRQASAPLAMPFGERVLAIRMPRNNTCVGDSGGPLFVKRDGVEVLAGVTSFSDRNCQQEAGFDSVDNQLDWIEEQIRKYDPGGLTGDGGPPPADAGSGDGEPPKADAASPVIDGAPSTFDAVGADSGGAPPASDAGGPPPADAKPENPVITPPAQDASVPPMTTGVSDSTGGGGCTATGRATIPLAGWSGPMVVAGICLLIRRRRQA